MTDPDSSAVQRLNAAGTRIQLYEIVVTHDVEDWYRSAFQKFNQDPCLMLLGQLRSIEPVRTPKKITGEHHGLNVLFSRNRHEPLIDWPFAVHIS